VRKSVLIVRFLKKAQRGSPSRALLLALTGCLLCSCSLVRLRQSVKQHNASGVIAVKVTNPSTTATNYALALSRSHAGSNEMIGFQVVGADGLALFLLHVGHTYSVAAFSDLNGNGTSDGGEPARMVSNIRPTPFAESSNRADILTLTLITSNALPRGQKIVLPHENSKLGDALPVSIGKIANLDEPKFSVEVGEMSMWQPYRFIEEEGFGIYFLDPYSPSKIPVLFVYGIGGSPQDWRTILQKIDRKKYQLWFYQYPTGFHLDKSANALANSLILLKQRYGFEHMDVVAHSMGGLVSRGGIQRAANLAKTNFVAHFISISTPWGGHELAQRGVKYMNYPVPSWQDMVPGSAYQKGILSKPLPAGTRYDLVFSYKSSGAFGLPDENDGVVSVQSELVPQVQQEARSVFGLHEDHKEILNSALTLRHIEKALSR
jgi:pimeloyl-ACP methyl ester carboxylesterase